MLINVVLRGISITLLTVNASVFLKIVKVGIIGIMKVVVVNLFVQD